MFYHQILILHSAVYYYSIVNFVKYTDQTAISFKLPKIFMFYSLYVLVLIFVIYTHVYMYLYLSFTGT